MLELIDIRKDYKTGGITQHALAGVSIAFRDTEFVAILGPSGSGKTTLLNILGGLDHATSGDLVINGTSTQGFRSKDWDTYRNHNIGFVFQSYNLIPHQSILSNVELALTLSGANRAERRARATRALERVGLGEHIHKLPSQLSGGQQQRVAIARALVNDPDIVLADEPTGALDGKTGIQIMNLLQEVAQRRLVIMVTHNPELAAQYATRTVRLQDGVITDDTAPFSAADLTAEKNEAPQALASLQAPTASATSGKSEPHNKAKSGRNASMSFLTALSLSFNNLLTKKARTLLTAFAGSIGIMGIAAILALSTGVNNYITKVQQDTMTSYPISLTKTSSNLGEMLANASSTSYRSASGTGQIPIDQMVTDTFSSVTTNDLASARAWLESGSSGVDQYATAISYDWGVRPTFYYADPSKGTAALDSQTQTAPQATLDWMNTMGMSSSQAGFQQLNANQSLVESQYNLVKGSWPTSANEAVLVLTSSGQIWDYTLYQIGVLDQNQFAELMNMASTGKKVQTPDLSKVNFTYDDALNLSFKVVEPFKRYTYNSSTSTWQDRTGDPEYMTQAINEGIPVKVVGVIQPKENASNLLNPGIAYTQALTDMVRRDAANSDIVKAQLANPEVDIFTNTRFSDLAHQRSNFDMSKLFSVDEQKFAEAFNFDSSKLTSALNTASLGSLGFDPSQFSADKNLALDLSTLKVDTSELSSALSPDYIKDLLANAPKPDAAQLANRLSDEQKSQLTDLTSQLAAGFVPWWYQQHPGEAMGADTDFASDLQAYLQTPDALALTQQLEQVAGETYANGVQSYVDSYLQEQVVPYLQNSLDALAQKAAQTLTASLALQLQSQLAVASQTFGTQLSQQIAGQLQGSLTSLQGVLQGAFSVNPEALAGAIKVNVTQDELASLMQNLAGANTQNLDSNLLKLGCAPDDNPQTINIYPKDFEAKSAIYQLIDQRNEQLEHAGKSDQALSYNDLMGVLLGSVTTIINAISTVLIAFVSISLVVSSIMIGVITYISVLERKKEIGILRAMGASKRNIANVFNAETFIEGLLSGVLAIAVVELVSIPINLVVYQQLQVPNVMSLSVEAGLILIGISVLLTLVAGLVPASSASRRDPVEALRSE